MKNGIVTEFFHSPEEFAKFGRPAGERARHFFSRLGDPIVAFNSFKTDQHKTRFDSRVWQHVLPSPQMPPVAALLPAGHSATETQ